MRIYIAGKVTGLDYLQVRSTFKAAEASIKARGYKVTNPINFCGERWPWWLCMVVCLSALLGCGAVAMLPGWESSRGANIERRFALALGKRVFDYRK